MFSHPIRDVMKAEKLLFAPPETTVTAAAKLMAKKRAGAIMVVENGKLTGILTERDLAFRVVARGRDPDRTLVAEVMTKKPITVHPDKPFGHALVLMHQNGFRHLPVVENGKAIGIISARNALDPDLEEFESEAQRRRHFTRTP